MYSKKFECPECSELLNESANKCNCGWRKGGASKSHDPRCIFILNGKRCNLVGSNSPHTFKNDAWHCSYHYDTLGDFAESERWGKFIEKYFQEIIHFRQHSQNNFKNCDRCEKLCVAEKEFRSPSPKQNALEDDYGF